MTNVPEGPLIYVLFEIIPALFVSLVAAVLAKTLEQENTRTDRIIFAAVLAIVSLAAVAFLHVGSFPVNIMVGFIGILWFPLAVIIASLCFRNLPCEHNLPSLVFVVTFIAYNAEMGFFYLGRWAGLRDAMVWIYPPVPMTYDLMLWPVWFHAGVQYFLTLVIAAILVGAFLRYPVLWKGQSPDIHNPAERG
nr:hypothetical protein [uncultured Methanoregula sp.]